MLVMLANCAYSGWRLARYPRSIILGTLVGLSLSGLCSDRSLSQTAKPAPVAPPNQAATAPTMRPILQPGATGTTVSELQALLKLLGYYQGTVTGTYDDATLAAVRQFQQAAGIQADGIAGLETWTRLLPATPPVAIATPTPAMVTNPATGSTAADSFPMPNASASVTPAPKPAAASPTAGAKPTTTRTQTATTNPVPMPILRVGMSGPAVTRLQERLKALGYLQGAIDGVFGPATETAVKAAQEKLKLTADGVVGPETWTKLAQ